MLLEKYLDIRMRIVKRYVRIQYAYAIYSMMGSRHTFQCMEKGRVAIYGLEVRSVVLLDCHGIKGR